MSEQEKQENPDALLAIKDAELPAPPKPPPPLASDTNVVSLKGGALGYDLELSDLRFGGDHEQDSWEIGDVRRKLGYLVSAASVGIMAWLLHLAFSEVAEFGRDIKDPQLAFKILLVKLAGHGIVTIASMFFGYQMLRAGERMALPHWWAEKHPQTAAMMLGWRSPLEGAAEIAGSVAKEVARELVREQKK